MTAMARYETASATSTSGATGNLGGPTAQRPSEALTLDGLLADLSDAIESCDRRRPVAVQ
jgi:hypothetical protein